MTTRHSPPASPSAPRSRAWLVGALLLAAAPIGLAVAPVPGDAQTASGVDDLALALDGFRFRELGPANMGGGCRTSRRSVSSAPSTRGGRGSRWGSRRSRTHWTMPPPELNELEAQVYQPAARPAPLEEVRDPGSEP